MKYFLDLKFVSSIPNSYECSAEDIMQITGLNTGNFAFRHALLNLVPNINEYLPVTWGDLSQKLKSGEKPEKVIISCANWLCESDAYESSNGVRADIIESLSCDVISFGLGAQARKKSDSIDLGQNTVRLAHALSSKCNSISVRDEFTAGVLKKYGVHNYTITGCPSNFINTSPDLGKIVTQKLEVLLDSDKGWPDVKALFSEFSGGHINSGAVLQRIMTLLQVSSSHYMIQTPNLYPFLLRETDVVHNAYLSNKPVGMSDDDFIRLLKSRLVGFSSIESWMDFARTSDFAVGMRIHGNMVPLQAGVPSIVIGHDSRTNGLSETMCIPVISPEEFVEISKISPKPLFEKMLETYSEYDSRRSVLLNIMNNFISQNGL